MDAFRHLSRVTTRVCELGLLGGFLWFEIQVAAGLFYLEVPENLGLTLSCLSSRESKSFEC